MIDRMKENVIEWIEGSRTATCTFSQKRFVNRIRKMSKTPGNSVEILHENEDGSIIARIPLKAIHIYIMASKTSEFAGVQNEDV